MMRALAGVSAAAVALIALPTTVGVAAEAESDTAVAISATTASSGITGFFQEPAILGLNMGAFLWLSVAFLAVVVAALAVSRSRAHVLDNEAPPGFAVPVTAAPSARLSTSISSGSLGQVVMPGFAIADASRSGR